MCFGVRGGELQGPNRVVLLQRRYFGGGGCVELVDDEGLPTSRKLDTTPLQTLLRARIWG